MEKDFKVLEEIGKQLETFGAEKWQPAGLISEYFPTQFNPSATHHQIYEILRGKAEAPLFKTKYVIESVFRVNDIDLVGDRTHLSLFKMLGAVKFIKPCFGDEFLKERIEFFENFFRFLKIFDFSFNKIFITYFSGGKIDGNDFKEDDIRIYLEKFLGNPENIIPLKGTLQFLYPSSKELTDLAGPRCDIYIKTDDGFFEIATVDMLPYLLEKGNVRQNEKFFLLGFYCGIERLISVKNKTFDVFKIEPLKILTENIFKILFPLNKNKNIFEICLPLLKKLTDRAISIITIVSSGQKADSSSRGRILRNLIKDFLRTIKDLYGDFSADLISGIFAKVKSNCQPFSYYNMDPQKTVLMVKEFYEQERVRA